ncbi:PREDICTED: serine protease snake isoform X1 [Rhagoletis zephyria]|uniref:serine protease snake isoform X1 n=2 Tax=Rhagoletis zephyria TaxID=28612 RepID=UPI000811263A|nr:PREDICTED: serine protease snake isoform X1 [Rhagoletis zephyria]
MLPVLSLGDVILGLSKFFKTMHGLCCFYKLLLLALFLSNAIGFNSPQVFQYYKSTKYTISKPWRGKPNIFEKLPDRMNIFKKNPPPPKREANIPNAYFYNVVNNANTALTAPNNQFFQLQPNSHVNNTDVYNIMDKRKNEKVTPTKRPEGSFCRRSFDGRAGYCILAHQCLHVIKEYREHGTKIDLCTHRQNVPVICCPLAEKQLETQSISAKKCQQYNDIIEGVKFDIHRTFSGKTCVPSLPLIVGGQVTNEGEYPHMAALGWTKIDEEIRWGCGGTLISERYVLTAAHCSTASENPPDIVRLGVPNLFLISTEAQDIRIAKIILHPKYRSFAYYHDIALMKLAQRAKITPKVRPACLWQLPDLDISTLVATGWGRTKFRGSRSDELLKVDLNMINQNLCKKLYKKERRLSNGILDEQFCAGHMTGGKDTCQGDSGGPLHAELPELKCVKFVVGITSFGKFCAKSNAPGVYTKIYPYLDWIEGIAFKDE